MGKLKSYKEESESLAIAIDIAIEAYINCIPKDWEQHHLDHVVSMHKEWKNNVINPEPQYKNLASLKHHIQDVFTYFQEGSGDTVEYFWNRIIEENLDYKRENKLEKILKRGKIRGRVEYDYLTDMILVAEQVGLSTKSETEKLSNMLAEYETKKKNN